MRFCSMVWLTVSKFLKFHLYSSRMMLQLTVGRAAVTSRKPELSVTLKPAPVVQPEAQKRCGFEKPPAGSVTENGAPDGSTCRDSPMFPTQVTYDQRMPVAPLKLRARTC